MASCTGCGSGVSDTQVICEFCGLVLRTVTDPIDEAKAVVELGRAWSRMGQSGLGTLLPGLAAQKSKAFWGAAFMPTTLEGLLAAGEQALGLIRPDAQLSDVRAMEMNKVLGSRLASIVELCELKGPGNERVEVLKRISTKKLAALAAGRKRAWRNYALLVGGLILLLVLMGAGVSLLPS